MKYSRTFLFNVLLVLMISNSVAGASIENQTLECDLDAGCGSRGLCDPSSSRCVCEEGWLNVADFVQTNDCGWNMIAIRCLWALNALELCWYVGKCGALILARVEHFLLVRTTKKGYTLWQNKGLLSLGFYLSVCFSSHLIFTVEKLINPSSRIGFDLLSTVLFFTAKLGLYMCQPLFQGPMLAATLKTEPRFNLTVTLNNICVTVVSVFTAMNGALAMFTYASYQDDIVTQRQILSAYYWIQASLLLVCAIQAYLIKYHVNRVLDKAKSILSSQKQTSQIRAKMNAVQNSVIYQGMLQAVILVLFATVPVLYFNHAYFLPISWLSMPIIGKSVAFQVDLDSTNVKSLLQRFGLKRSTTLPSDHGSPGSSNRDRTLTSPGFGGSSFNLKSGGKVGHLEPLAEAEPMPVSQTRAVSAFPGGYEARERQRQKRKETNKKSTMAASSDFGDMDDVMDLHGSNRALFADFVRKKFASESLELYDDIGHYLDRVRAGGSEEEIAALGNAIVDRYVADAAPNGVDLPYLVRMAMLEQRRAQKYSKGTMYQVRQLMYILLRDNFLFQFLNETEGGQQMFPKKSTLEAAFVPRPTAATDKGW